RGERPARPHERRLRGGWRARAFVGLEHAGAAGPVLEPPAGVSHGEGRFHRAGGMAHAPVTGPGTGATLVSARAVEGRGGRRKGSEPRGMANGHGRAEGTEGLPLGRAVSPARAAAHGTGRPAGGRPGADRRVLAGRGGSVRAGGG